jgi:hypothetical protein
MFAISWCKKSDYPGDGKNWKKSMIKVFLPIHNKTYYMDFHNFEDALIEVGCPYPNQAEKEINDFLCAALLNECDFTEEI